MHRSRRLLALLGSLAAALGVLAAWLLLHNPTVKSTTLGDYTCSAPYDTVLNDADNVPGGEPPADAAAVQARCIDSAESRFALGVAFGAAALVLSGLTAARAGRTRTTAEPSDAPAANVAS